MVAGRDVKSGRFGSESNVYGLPRGRALPSIIESRTLPRVLVLLAARNGRDWILQQINSILIQEGVEVQLLVSDDASTDGTPEIVRQEFSNDGRVEVIQREIPSGSAGAHFYSLFLSAKTANCDYVALSDQDDIWQNSKLAGAVAALRSSSASGYSSSVEAFWPTGRTKLIAQVEQMTRGDFLFEGAGQGCTFVVTAEFFQRVKKWMTVRWAEVSAVHYHDWMLYFLARSWGLAWYFDARATVRYRQHAGNEIGSRGTGAAVLRRFAKIRSGWYRKEVSRIAGLYVSMDEISGGVARDLALVFSGNVRAGRFRRALYLIRWGRRSYVDRIVQVVAALLDWL